MLCRNGLALDPVVDGLSRAANGSGQRRLPAGNFDCFYKCVHADILHTWGIKSQHVKYAQEASGATFRRFRASVPRFAIAEFFCSRYPHTLTILNTCVEYAHRLPVHPPDSRPRRFQPFPTGNKATGTTSPWPAAEPIPESRFTRIGGELYRLRNRAVPCIRPREAASESLATAIDGGYQVEPLEKLALGRESRPVTPHQPRRKRNA